jgi:hypothetical protein
MQISMIADENGGDKAVLSKFPMKGVKPSWFMMASGNGRTAELRVLIYK